MGEHATMSWLALIGLGAFHGVNPAMGWLFAVALGMQEKRRSAVYQALLPLAAGHALAVAAAVLLAVAINVVIPLSTLRPALALVLALFGVSRLFRHWHPRWVSMRVGLGGLTLWSFLMATAHGAGLMVAPVFLGIGAMPEQHGHAHGATAGSASMALAATGAHAAAYLAVTAVIAILIFEKFGVGLLRRTWFNIDRLWAVALIAAGAVIAFV